MQLMQYNKEGGRMKFILPFPVSAMKTEGQKELWREIYKELGEPSGHTIGSSNKCVCNCKTCQEYIKRSA